MRHSFSYFSFKNDSFIFSKSFLYLIASAFLYPSSILYLFIFCPFSLFSILIDLFSSWTFVYKSIFSLFLILIFSSYSCSRFDYFSLYSDNSSSMPFVLIKYLLFTSWYSFFIFSIILDKLKLTLFNSSYLRFISS